MMAEKFIEVSPKDVIWDNIDVCSFPPAPCATTWRGPALTGTADRTAPTRRGSDTSRRGWATPVAFVGTLSNVSTLCERSSECAASSAGIVNVDGVLLQVALLDMRCTAADSWYYLGYLASNRASSSVDYLALALAGSVLVHMMPSTRP